MPHTLISKKASNWVDRGEPPHPAIERVLARLLDRNVDTDPGWFREQAESIIGMVHADATEVHVVGFLRTLFTPTTPPRDSTSIRTAAIAVWHIAKAGLVRDLAERVFRGDVPSSDPTPDTLGHWLAKRLLTPEQLAEFEATADREPSDG